MKYVLVIIALNHGQFSTATTLQPDFLTCMRAGAIVLSYRYMPDYLTNLRGYCRPLNGTTAMINDDEI